MKTPYAKLVRVALLYGGAGYLIQCVFGILVWQLFPNKPADDELMRLVHWTQLIMAEKIVGLVLLSIAAFLASRAHHPTRKWGLATGIATGVAYQVIAMLVYLLRFGLADYIEYNNFLSSMMWSIGLAWLASKFAMRKQFLYEKCAT